MKFKHTFRVKASLADVAEFHSRAASMPAITPPPMIVQVHRAPARLGSGDEMDFTLWAGPIPLRWVARIDDASQAGFTDRQLRGPFANWVHRHGFVRVSDAETDVVDDVEVELSPKALRRALGAAMWIGLPLLFAYRGWRTRRLLEAER